MSSTKAAASQRLAELEDRLAPHMTKLEQVADKATGALDCIMSWCSTKATDLVGKERLDAFTASAKEWTDQNICPSIDRMRDASAQMLNAIHAEVAKAATNGAYSSLVDRDALDRRQQEVEELNERLLQQAAADQQKLSEELDKVQEDLLKASVQQQENDKSATELKRQREERDASETVQAAAHNDQLRREAQIYAQTASRASVQEKIVRRKMRRLQEQQMLHEAARALEIKKTVLRQAAEDELRAAQAEEEQRALALEYEQATAEMNLLETELEKVQQDKAAAEAMAKAAGANAIAQEELAALQRAKRKALEQKIESRRQEAAAERHRQAQMNMTH